MDTSPHTSHVTGTRRPRMHRSERAAAGALTAVLLLAGCGLRLETPDPEPLVPDETEIVRARTVADAVLLDTLAGEAAEHADPEQGAVLEHIAQVSAAHLDALGGVYEPFPDVTAPPEPEPAPTDSPPPPPAPPATVDDVLAALTEAAARARSDADSFPDGSMARLLASISVSRTLLANALAAAQGTVAGPVVAFVVPEALPGGLTPQQAGVLVQSEDATGLAWEVTAARSADADRGLAAARAVVHRERAHAWAEAAGLAGSGTDPRRSSYALPAAFTDPDAPPEALRAALELVETELAVAYMSLTAHAAVDSRGVLIDAVLDAIRLSGTGRIAAFPGLPEHDG